MKNEVINKRAAENHMKTENSENRYLKDIKYRKVTNHCHYTGEYRGAADSIFNFKYSVPKMFL